MEKKIEVEIDGKKFRIMEHLLEDASRFGASVIKRQVKEPPKELTMAKKDIVKTVLPPMIDLPVPTDETIEAPVKKPIRRKKK